VRANFIAIFQLKKGQYRAELAIRLADDILPDEIKDRARIVVEKCRNAADGKLLQIKFQLFSEIWDYISINYAGNRIVNLSSQKGSSKTKQLTLDHNPSQLSSINIFSLYCKSYIHGIHHSTVTHFLSETLNKIIHALYNSRSCTP
jgi:hypothetical protein